jgi:nitroreductase
MSILMGWRNGGPGRHAVEFADGRKHVVEVGADGAPARVLDADGKPLGTITAGSPSEYRSADGATVLSIEPDGEPTPGKVPMLVRRADGEVAARLVDVRTNTEWRVRDSLRAAADLYMLLTASGAGSLPIRRFGTQISSATPPSAAEVDALVAISVAICIGMCDLVPQLEPARRSR